MSAIGLDIGHSAVKIAVSDAQGKRHFCTVPTAVCQAFKISDEVESHRAAKETVRVGSLDYFIGDTAVIQGGSSVTSGLSEDWISTPEHTALMIGCYRKALELSGSENPRLVLGLPTNLYTRQRDKLMDLAVSLLASSDVRVIPQPMAPYFEMAFDENGLPIAARNEESWGVVEIGYFTTDFMLMMDGRWVEKASGACAGARVAAEHLQRILGEKGISADLPECEEALRKKFIRNFTKKIDVTDDVNEAVGILVNEVVDTATRLMEPYARKIDGIIVAGGGAEFMYEKIKAKWPHAVMPTVPRMSVAEGMRRFASMLSLKDAVGQAATGE